MNANDVIRTNDLCGFWDVPGTDKMVHSYGTMCGQFILEVIEPSDVMGHHRTITFLEHYWTKKSVCYGMRHTLRSDIQPDQKTLWAECYGTISEVFGWDTLLDAGQITLDMGRIRITPDN